MSNPVQYQLVQTVAPAVTTGNLTATLTPTLAGSTILVFFGTSSTFDTVGAPTDNAGNTYTLAYSSSVNTEIRCYYALNAKPTSQVKSNFVGTTDTHSMIVREYGGLLGPIDRTITSNNTITVPETTGASAITRNANELVVCSSGTTNTGLGDSMSAGAGFGNFLSVDFGSQAGFLCVEDKTVSTTGAQTGVINSSNASPNWDIGLATFQIADGKFAKPSNNLRPHPFSPGLAR